MMDRSEPFGFVAAACTVAYILAAAYVVQELLDCGHRWKALIAGVIALLILGIGIQHVS